MNPISNFQSTITDPDNSIWLRDLQQFKSALDKAKLNGNAFAIHAIKNIDDKKYSLKFAYSVLCLLCWLWQDDDTNPWNVDLKEVLKYNFLLHGIVEIHCNCVSTMMPSEDLENLFHAYYYSITDINAFIKGMMTEKWIVASEIDKNKNIENYLKIYSSCWLKIDVSAPIQHLLGLLFLRFGSDYIHPKHMIGMMDNIFAGFPNDQWKEQYLRELIPSTDQDTASAELKLILENTYDYLNFQKPLDNSDQKQDLKNQGRNISEIGGFSYKNVSQKDSQNLIDNCQLKSHDFIKEEKVNESFKIEQHINYFKDVISISHFSVSSLVTNPFNLKERVYSTLSIGASPYLQTGKIISDLNQNNYFLASSVSFANWTLKKQEKAIRELQKLDIPISFNFLKKIYILLQNYAAITSVFIFFK